MDAIWARRVTIEEVVMCKKWQSHWFWWKHNSIKGKEKKSIQNLNVK
jgi:hypothetical protein